MKRRLVVLKSSTSSSLLPSDLVEQANAQLQRILADRNHGIPQQHSSEKCPMCKTCTLYKVILSKPTLLETHPKSN